MKDTVFNIVWGVVILAIITAIVLSITIPTLAYQHKKVAIFEAAVEAGMIQAPRVGDNGYIWVKP